MTQSPVVIAGGYGLVGSTIARHLRRISRDVPLILAGRRPERAAQLAAELGHADVVRLDLDDEASPLGLPESSLIVAALQDPGDRLIDHAARTGSAHIGITKVADEIAPVVATFLRTPPPRPIVLAGHWQAGMLLLATAEAARAFRRIDSVRVVAIYDTRDPIGPMTEHDVSVFVARALVREEGRWRWADAASLPRVAVLDDGREVEATPLGVLDVPGLAALTGAPDIRFDFATATSRGSARGAAASHDMFVDIEGCALSGEPARRRTILSDPRGNAHLTGLGAALLAERVLGLDGQPPTIAGLHMPDTVLDPAATVTRLRALGVTVETTAMPERAVTPERASP